MFCDAATCHTHFRVKQHQEKKRQTRIQDICFDGNCILMQILHKLRGTCSRSLHLSTTPYKKKQIFRNWISSYPWVKGCGDVLFGVWQGAVSITEPVNDSSLSEPAQQMPPQPVTCWWEQIQFWKKIFFFHTYYDPQVNKPYTVFEGYIQLVWGQYDK